MYKRGDRWYSDFFRDGERFTKSWGAISKTVAIEKDHKFRTEVIEGKHGLKAKKISFETFAEKYLEDARLNKKPKSAIRNEVSIGQLKPYLNDKLLSAIHPYLIEQYKRDRREQGRAPATVNRDVATLRNMLNKAVLWGYLPLNPLAGIKSFREDNDKMWALTAAEEACLLTVCDKVKQRKKYLRDLITFALNSGMRESEIFNLKKSAVDLQGQHIHVTDTKNHEDRKVPINGTLAGILKRKLSEDGQAYVFTNAAGGKLTVLTNSFWKAIADAGLVKTTEKGKERFRFHDLRHTFGSRLGMAHVDLKTIMEIMGHKTHKVALRYQHPAPDHKLNAVKTLDRVPLEFTTAEKEGVKIRVVAGG